MPETPNERNQWNRSVGPFPIHDSDLKNGRLAKPALVPWHALAPQTDSVVGDFAGTVHSFPRPDPVAQGLAPDGLLVQRDNLPAHTRLKAYAVESY